MVESLVDHPDRVMLANVLADAPVSAAELAEKTQLPVAKVRRELRAMKEEGLIESVKSEGRRGTVEHFYTVIGEMILDKADLGELNIDQRRRLNSQILKLALAEAIAALVTKPSRRSIERDDSALVRIPMRVDERGWKEVAEIHEETIRRVLDAREKIAARLATDGDDLFWATSLIVFFDAETSD